MNMRSAACSAGTCFVFLRSNGTTGDYPLSCRLTRPMERRKSALVTAIDTIREFRLMAECCHCSSAISGSIIGQLDLLQCSPGQVPGVPTAQLVFVEKYLTESRNHSRRNKLANFERVANASKDGGLSFRLKALVDALL